MNNLVGYIYKNEKTGDYFIQSVPSNSKEILWNIIPTVEHNKTNVMCPYCNKYFTTNKTPEEVMYAMINNKGYYHQYCSYCGHKNIV